MDTSYHEYGLPKWLDGSIQTYKKGKKMMFPI